MQATTEPPARFPASDYLCLQVLEIDHRLSGLTRLVLHGEALATFATFRPGAWIRVFIPGPEGDVGRAFSLCAVDRERRQLEIQVLHRRYGGRRTQWLAEQARPGDRLYVSAPRGGAMPSLDVDWHCMLGDETALPAISQRLAWLAPSMPAQAWLDVPCPATAYRPEPRIHYLTRGRDEDDQPSRLWQALAELPLPHGRGELWIAGESALVRQLESWCRQHWAHCQLELRAIGYWQRPVLEPG